MSDAATVNGTEVLVSAAPVVESLPAGLVVDATRLKHKHARQITIIQARLRQGEASMTADEVERQLKAVDDILVGAVVSLPDGWLPDGVTLKSEDWIGELTEAQWNTVFLALQSPPGKKTD